MISFRVTRLLNLLVTIKEIFRQYRDYAMLMYLSKPKIAKAAFGVLAPSLNNNESDNLGQKRKNRRS
jgi:hypothetical protein